MPLTLTFLSAKSDNPGTDGVEVAFSFQVSDEEGIRQLRIVGMDYTIPISWNMSFEEKSKYAMLLFSGVIEMVQLHWLKYKVLPEDDRVYYSNSDFYSQPTKKTNWAGYVLELE